MTFNITYMGILPCKAESTICTIAAGDGDASMLHSQNRPVEILIAQFMHDIDSQLAKA